MNESFELERKIDELWFAANIHSLEMMGEFVDHEIDHGTEKVPDRPKDKIETIQKIIQYLKESI